MRIFGVGLKHINADASRKSRLYHFFSVLLLTYDVWGHGQWRRIHLRFYCSHAARHTSHNSLIFTTYLIVIFTVILPQPKFLMPLNPGDWMLGRMSHLWLFYCFIRLKKDLMLSSNDERSNIKIITIHLPLILFSVSPIPESDPVPRARGHMLSFSLHFRSL